MRRGEIIAAAILTPVAALGIFQYAHTQNESNALFRAEVDKALVADGFDRGHDIYNRPANILPETVGELVVGSCTFHNVTAETSFDPTGKHLTNLHDYTLDVGQVETGKHHNLTRATVSLTFQNADQLQAQLPNLVCDA